MANRYDVARRILDVKQKLIEGYPTVRLLDYIMNEYKVGSDNAYAYVKGAMIELKESINYDLEEKRAHRITQLEELYFESLKNGDNNTAKNVIAEINKLEGLYKDQSQQLHGNLDININWSNENKESISESDNQSESE